MADYYRHFAVAVRLHGKLAPAWVHETLRDRQRQRRQLEDADEPDKADALAVDFDWSIEDGSLSLRDNGESGNVEHVVTFLRELLRLGYAQEPITMQWADSCSRPRPDAFTGGAVIVTRRRTHWFVVPELVEKKLQALERRRRTAR